MPPLSIMIFTSNTPRKESNNTKCNKNAEPHTPVPGPVEELEERIGALEDFKRKSEDTTIRLDDSLERVESNIQAVYQDVAQCRLDASSAFDHHHQRLGALRNVCEELIKESDAQE